LNRSRSVQVQVGLRTPVEVKRLDESEATVLK
jgi:hypothetical protein